jgi:hypothetical protein
VEAARVRTIRGKGEGANVGQRHVGEEEGEKGGHHNGLENHYNGINRLWILKIYSPGRGICLPVGGDRRNIGGGGGARERFEADINLIFGLLALLSLYVQSFKTSS